MPLLKSKKSMLITSEMMQTGVVPLLFTGGACNIQELTGPIRNPGRDPLAKWLDEKEWSYFDPQIHPITHGRDYIWGIDGPQEKKARHQAKLRVYEITATTLAAVSMLEVMDDARSQRPSIVWFNGGRIFTPIGLVDLDHMKRNDELRQEMGEAAYSHLIAYINAGNQLRNELLLTLSSCQYIVFVNNFEELKKAIIHLLLGPAAN